MRMRCVLQYVANRLGLSGRLDVSITQNVSQRVADRRTAVTATLTTASRRSHYDFMPLVPTGSALTGSVSFSISVTEMAGPMTSSIFTGVLDQCLKIHQTTDPAAVTICGHLGYEDMHQTVFTVTFSSDIQNVSPSVQR